MLTVEAIEENLFLQIQEDDISLTMQIADSAPSGVVVSGAPGNVLQTNPDGLYVGAVQYVQTIDDLALIKPNILKNGQSAQIVSTGRAGLFRWTAGDLSAEVAADPLRGIYVPADGDDGSVGAWVREDRSEVTPQMFGAVGDGAADDLPAFQAAVDTGMPVAVPKPAVEYLFSGPLKFKHTGSYYRLDTGQRIYGTGRDCFITRGDSAPSNYINTASAGMAVAPGAGVTTIEGEPFINNTAAEIILTAADAASVAADGLTKDYQGYVDEACFAVFGANYEISGFVFRDCRNAFYSGQDPDQVGTENSSPSFNRIAEVRAYRCSVGMRLRDGGGSHYCRYSDNHIWQCQVGYDLGNLGVTPLNNINRNYWSDNRAARCHVGYYIRRGATNTFVACHTEGCGPTPANNTYGSAPAGLPLGEASWSWINTGSGNWFFRCVDEGNDRKLYSDDGSAGYIGTIFGDYIAGSTQAVFNVPPGAIMNHITTFLSGGGFKYLANSNSSLTHDPLGPSVSGNLDIGGATRLSRGARRNDPRTAAFTDLIDIGPVSSGVPFLVEVWPLQTTGFYRGGDASLTAKVTVTGNNLSSNRVDTCEFTVVARRNSARTIVRHAVLNQSNANVTGAGAGDTVQNFTPTVDITGNVLSLSVNPDNRAYDFVAVKLDAILVRPTPWD